MNIEKIPLNETKEESKEGPEDATLYKEISEDAFILAGEAEQVLWQSFILKIERTRNAGDF